MTMKGVIQIGVAAAAATLLALTLTGCGATNAALTLLNGGPCKPGPTVFVVPDVSGSTTVLRQPGGLYAQATETAITATARSCGSLYAGNVDGNGLNTAWTIDGKAFRQTVGGNDELGPGGYSLYATPIGTVAERQAFIAQLNASGEVPNLTGFDVYLPGLGVGVTNRDLAKAVIELWQELIPLTGGRLRSIDGSLPLAWPEPTGAG